MYRSHTLTLTAGATGGGTVTSEGAIEGRINALCLAYGGTAAPTLALSTVAQPGTIIGLASFADGTAWYYPTVQAHDGTAGLRAWYQQFPVADQVCVAMTGGVVGDQLTAIVIVEQ